jgi:hypothetical protein
LKQAKWTQMMAAARAAKGGAAPAPTENVSAAATRSSQRSVVPPTRYEPAEQHMEDDYGSSEHSSTDPAGNIEKEGSDGSADATPTASDAETQRQIDEKERQKVEGAHREERKDKRKRKKKKRGAPPSPSSSSTTTSTSDPSTGASGGNSENTPSASHSSTSSSDDRGEGDGNRGEDPPMGSLSPQGNNSEGATPEDVASMVKAFPTLPVIEQGNLLKEVEPQYWSEVMLTRHFLLTAVRMSGHLEADGPRHAAIRKRTQESSCAVPLEQIQMVHGDEAHALPNMVCRLFVWCASARNYRKCLCSLAARVVACEYQK